MPEHSRDVIAAHYYRVYSSRVPLVPLPKAPALQPLNGPKCSHLILYIQLLQVQYQKSLNKFKVAPKLFKYSTVKGDAAKTLVKQVKNSTANLVAVGVNARAGLGHLKLGGITAQLLIDPPCDVPVSKGY